MNKLSLAKKMAQTAFEPFEALNSQLVKPIGEEAVRELGGFMGSPRLLGKQPKELAGEELKRARQKEELDEKQAQDHENSQESAQQVSITIKQEYRLQESKNGSNQEQKQLKEEFFELRSEIAKLAKDAGVQTKAHLETVPQKIGILDIRRLTAIARFLRMKAEESKSAKELVFARSNAKRTTGMLAWVSGKQMKVHEQGTLQLQG